MSRVFALLLLLLGGCLSSQYTVTRSELLRVAALPAEQRGESLHVRQQLAPTEDVLAPAPVYPAWVAPFVVIEGAPYGQRGQRRRPRSGRDPDESATEGASMAATTLAVGAAAAFGLVATEGARFDGVVRTPPAQPLYLLRPNGRIVRLTLAELTPEQASLAVRGVLSEDEGELTLLDRSPLNRAGFSFGIDIGAAQLDSQANEVDYGFAGRLTLGGFPISELGVRVGAEWAFGAADGADLVFNERYFGELVAFPVVLGRLHVGVYGQLGYSAVDEDRDDRLVSEWDGVFFGGGVGLEIEVTTRFAFQLRGGALALPGLEGQVIAPEATAGLSIY